MQLATAHGSEALDLSSITAKGLCDIVPDVGLFVAEDIVAWRDAHSAFPDELTLITELGLRADTAAELSRLIGGDEASVLERPSGVQPQGRAVDASAAANEMDEEAGPDPVEAPDSGTYLQADGLVELIDPAPVASSEPPPARDSPVPPPIPFPALRAVPAVEASEDAADADAPGADADAAHSDVDAGADSDAGADADADSPEPAPAPAASAPSAPAAVVAAAAVPGRRWRKHLVVGVVMVVAVNAGLAFGIVQTRREGRRAVRPIAAITSDLHALKGEQADSRSTLDATRAELEETRRELAKQSSLLQATAASATELAAQQQTTDRELKELAKRESSDIATLAARLRERRNADGGVGVSLGEAVQLIDATNGTPPAKVDVHAPRAADHGKPAAAPPVDW